MAQRPHLPGVIFHWLNTKAPHARFQGVSPHGWRGDAMLQLDWNVGALPDRLANPTGDGNHT